MTNYYDILPGASVGGQAGVAYIKNYTGLNLLPKQGLVKEWKTKYFSLKNGGYTDYLPANIGCRLCSEKMRDILDRCKSEKDVLQWLNAEVESETGEKRHYFILHFPVLEDVLDKKKSKYVRNILTNQVINPKACVGHDVFSYIEESTISFIVSQRVREELKKAGCKGLVYLQMSPKKKSYVPKAIRKLCRIFYKKRVQTDEKKIRQNKENINLTHLEGLNLPQDLVDFISHGKSLSYDEEKCIIGHIELVPIESLMRGRIYVDKIVSNQNDLREGYYIVPAVDLIAECEGFDAWGVLVWLPDIQKFGAWDCDHRELRVFSKAKWSNIVEDPIKYLNAQWKSTGAEIAIFVASDKYPFVEERAK